MVNNKIKKNIAKNLIIIGGFFLLSNINSYAYNENVDLTHKSIVRNFGGLYDDCYESAIKIDDNDYIAVGYSGSINLGFTNLGGSDGIIVKYDNNGNKKWVKNFSGNNNDFLESIIKTQDGGYVIVGESGSTNAGFSNNGDFNSIIIKYDKNDNQEWLKSFGGSGYEDFCSVIETQDGGFIAVGKTNWKNTGLVYKGGHDTIIARYDKDGNQEWVKSFGGSDTDIFKSLIETPDGGVLAVGNSSSTNAGFVNKGSTDGIIVKYDKDGNQEWVKNFGGSNADNFNSIIGVPDGGFITIGDSNSTNAGFVNKGSTDGIIVKYDKDGNQEWVKNFGGSDTDIFNSINKTQDNEFIVLGSSYSNGVGFTNNGSIDGIIVKYDKDGNQLWVKSFGGSNIDVITSVIENSENELVMFGGSNSSNAGFIAKGSYDCFMAKYDKYCIENEEAFISVKNVDINKNLRDYFQDIKSTKDKGFITVGYSYSNNIGFINKGQSDGVIVKYDKYNNQEWVKNFGGSGYEYLYSVIETQDEGFVAVGDSTSTDAGFVNKGEMDSVIVKFDKDGNQQWVKSFGGSDYDYFYSVTETQDEGIVAVGFSYSTDAGFVNKGEMDSVIVKFEKDGNQQWVKSFGGSIYDYFYSVTETQDEGIVAVGFSYSTDAGFVNKGLYDAILVKYDKNGNQQWVKNFGGSTRDYFYSVKETQDGGFITVGISDSTDAGFVKKGLYDAIIVKYDKNGNQQWVKSFGGSIYDYFYSVTETQDEGFIAVGYGNSTDAGFVKKGLYDAILVKYDKNGNQQWVKSFGGSNYDYFKSVVKSQDGGFIAVGYSNSTDAGFNNKGEDDEIIVKYDIEGNHEWVKTIKIKNVNNLNEFTQAREKVNRVTNEEIRSYLNNKLNIMERGFGELELKVSSNSLDIYIKSENLLIVTIDTNSITFDEFSGIEDVEKANAINITLNSSLPYSLNAYLPTEIQNTDKSRTMDKSILNIKENSESTYQTFVNTTEKIVLKDNCPAGNSLMHGIDLKLKGSVAHEKDVYKTTIKLEIQQK